MTLRTLNYGNYGIFLIMGNAGFCPSTVVNPRQQDSWEVKKGPRGLPARSLECPGATSDQHSCSQPLKLFRL